MSKKALRSRSIAPRDHFADLSRHRTKRSELERPSAWRGGELDESPKVVSSTVEKLGAGLMEIVEPALAASGLAGPSEPAIRE